MLVLGMDSATSACSVAVLRDGRVVAHEFEAMVERQAAALIPMIARVLKAASSSVIELANWPLYGADALACGASTVGWFDNSGGRCPCHWAIDGRYTCCYGNQTF